MRQIDLVKVYSQKRCLIVDDMPDIRVLLSGMLKTFGVQEVDTAAHGEHAIEICQDTHYDMVLCDYNLGPGMDGQQVLEELRYRNRLNNTSIFVMITAESSREMVLGALEYQPDDYVTKPITTALMRTRLDRVVVRNRELFAIKQAMDERDYAKAILCCDDRLNNNTRYRSACLQIQAEMNLRVFNFKQAEDIYRGVLSERPVVWAKLGLGKTLLAKKEYTQAQQKLEEVIDEDKRYVEAYDLLSDSYRAQGNNYKAQQVMEQAAEISPKSIMRQRRLTALAKLNEDTEKALQAARQVLRVGRNSCYESPEDYFSLARDLTELATDPFAPQGSDYIKESLEILGRVERRPFFSPSVNVQVNAIKSRAMLSQQKTEEAATYLDRAKKIVETNGVPITPEASLDLVQSLLANNEKFAAESLLQALAEKHHSDPSIAARIDALSDSPRSKEGRQQAADMTKVGISHYEAKDYESAIAIFKNAVTVFPSHIGLNLNLVQAIVADSKSQGVKSGYERMARKALLQISKIDATDSQFARYDYLKKQVDEIFH